MLIFILIYLIGFILAAVILAKSAQKDGLIRLNDLLIGIVTCVFSFAGIAFLWLLNKCGRIADKHENPVIWQRKKEDKQK